VAGVIWIDLDRDGVHDPDEAPLPGVTVVLHPASAAMRSPFAAPDTAPDAAASAAPVQQVTGTDGSYAFEDVVPGAYSVSADLAVAGVQPWWDSDGAGDWQVAVSVPVGTATADLAAVGAGSLSGNVFVRATQAAVGDAQVSCRWSGLDGVLDTADDATFVLHAGADGGFAVADVPFGSYRCQAADEAGEGRTSDVATASVGAAGETAVVGLPIDSSAADPGHRDLAFTGARLLAEVALAGLLLVAGLGCVVAARRAATRR
jgi:hypothetical protein